MAKKTKKSFFKPSLFCLEDRTTPTAFIEPVTLSSVNGVLDITLTAHQSVQPLETLVGGVPTSISTSQFYTYAWKINQGSSSDLQTSGDSYPGPTLKVDQGQILRLRLENNLQNLTITPAQGAAAVTEQPINNHTHGMHISPSGSSDNVVLSLPPGDGFVYEYKIDNTQQDGLYWIHTHRHEFSSDQVYRGLSSMLVIGDSASNIQELSSLPHRAMALQFQLLGNQGLATQFIKDFTTTGSKASGQQFSINGLVNPTITAGKNQTEVWSVVNMTPDKIMSFTLSNTTTSTVLPLVVVAQDGIAYNTPVTIAPGQPLFLGTGGRLSFLVNAPANTMEKVSLSFTATRSNQTNTITIIADTTAGTNLPTPSQLTSENLFVDLSGSSTVIAENRNAVFNIDPFGGGKSAIFTINGQQFPNPTVFQPRIGTVEEWTLLNTSGVIHPFHIHVNDLQVMSSFDPTGQIPNVTTPQQWYQDVVNIPAGKFDANNNLLEAGQVVMRTRPLDYTGTYVFHCHILNHEDRGMMTLVNTLPNVPVYSAGAGAGGGPAVNVYSSLNNQAVASFFAFEPEFSGGVDTAMADVNNDGFSDLIAGAGPGGGPRVRVFDGASNYQTILFDFFAFAEGFRGGVDVAGGDFNFDGFADIVAGAGPGGGPMARIFDGQTGALLTELFAYDVGFTGGITVAVNDIDGSSFNSLVTGAGPGGGPHVKTWRNSPFYTLGSTPVFPGAQAISLEMTSQFFAYEDSYTGGVQVATGLSAGMSMGGFARILTGTLSAGPRVTIWEMSMGEMDFTSAVPMVEFEQTNTFFAFDPALANGVRVATVSVSTGSDILASNGPGGPTFLERFSFLPGAMEPSALSEIEPFTGGFSGGVFPGGTN